MMAGRNEIKWLTCLVPPKSPDILLPVVLAILANKERDQL